MAYVTSQIQVERHCVVTHMCAPAQARQNYNEAVIAQIVALRALGYNSAQIVTVLDELLAIARKLSPLKL